MATMYSLRDVADLSEFVLENVEHFGEERVLGTGSYGSLCSRGQSLHALFLCTVSSVIIELVIQV